MVVAVAVVGRLSRCLVGLIHKKTSWDPFKLCWPWQPHTAFFLVRCVCACELGRAGWGRGLSLIL